MAIHAKLINRRLRRVSIDCPPVHCQEHVVSYQVNSRFFAAAVLALCGSAAAADGTSQAGLKAQAKVSEAAARSTALAKVHKGTISSAELEREHGRLIWSFDIAKPGTRNITEIQVDAKTGKVVSTQVETPGKEAMEAAAEVNEKLK